MSSFDSKPEGGFAHFDLGRRIQRGIDAAGFTEPRPIQETTIPAALDGRDILGLAQTGTGKTAAFALPVLERLMATRGSSPRVLILAPTRELAAQIDAEIKTLARFTDIRSTTVFGGVSVNKQIAALRQRPEIVVACPGRLLDLEQQRAIRLDNIETLVIDEADHMFDMGFLPDIRRILAKLPSERQNLLFSATMPKEIRSLADGLLNDPHVVDVAHATPLATIEHALYPVNGKRKIDLLERVLDDDAFVSAIVFTRTKHRAKRIARQLDNKGYKAVALQGNMSQGQRERAMEGFRRNQFDILVATDIAARGIDVAQVSHVINFDMPDTPDAYTHRIGRTGRAEREGKAYTFVTGDDAAAVRDVERRIGSSIPRRSLDGFDAGDIHAVEGPKPRGRSNGSGSGSGRFNRGGGARTRVVGSGGGGGRSRSGNRNAGGGNRGSGSSGGRGSATGGGTGPGSGSSPSSRRRRSRRPSIRQAS